MGTVLDSSRPGANDPFWLSQYTKLVNSAGTAEFAACLFELLNCTATVDHCAVFKRTRTGSLEHFFTHGRMDPGKGQQLARDYVEHFHPIDPAYRAVTSHNSVDEVVVGLDFGKDYDEVYRKHFFEGHNLVEKLSSFGHGEFGVVYCNFYRFTDTGRFSEQECQVLKGIMPFVTSIIGNHLRLLSRDVFHDRNLGASRECRELVPEIFNSRHEPFDCLTSREREVCQRVLTGHTSLGISLDLSIALSSVTTYRKRAYQKLGIACQNELFALALQASSRLGAVRDQGRSSWSDGQTLIARAA